MFNIEEELKKLPAKPGVYIMRDKHDTIIYVGKAISLKNRVRQYFQSSRNLMPKIVKMVSKIDHFEYIITDSEVEALVLESNLIKEHMPRYNTMLKDDKNYPYIKVTVQEAYPRVMMARQVKKDKAKYFGPYTSVLAVKDTLDLLRKIYQIRTCNRNLPRDIGKERACLYYHIKQCSGPCQGYISEEEYRESIDQIIDFLNGNFNEVLSMLEKKMMNASENMEFEEAAGYRDLMNSVRQMAQKQKITNMSNQEDKDIIAFARAGDEAVVQVFFIRNGKLIGREHYHLTGVENDTREGVMTSFVKQFYAGTPFIPRELLLQEDLEEPELITEWLSAKRGQKVYIHVPKKGEKEKLVELAEKNASLVLQQDSEKIKKEEQRTKGAMKEIENLLGLDSIKRIESFDISNINGFESVGSMVVYENGKPKRNDYRKFKIKWVTGSDDYASMNEVLTRRFIHGKREKAELLEKNMDLEHGSFTRFPDLIMMDGGRGQVNIALKVMEELHLTIPVCGMVKDDNHRTRGLYFNNIEIPIDRSSEGFKLITRIQDETHRFAIEYHRSLRSKGQVHSILDDIPGIGPKRRKELMKNFLSLDAIKEATIEQLSIVPTMNEMAAKQVYEFFHNNDDENATKSNN
ncbi:Excinuclease ABC subunit C [Anaerosporobacter mobilis DSM 15930]|uniref:UvrABC system protein C n=1 Tax=Anaerosporobacter mobilis DSM 15930 TaxID=1120996 RepID=A0A1M7HFI8_9FIRM|nr:excinuclease ABC subunit UvrC [Anaerosporobacter mobilis]SHM27301.1 Excinuclease ABC subunit C [Anaerosporobacter mobilis DSM 15930]